MCLNEAFGASRQRRIASSGRWRHGDAIKPIRLRQADKQLDGSVGNFGKGSKMALRLLRSTLIINAVMRGTHGVVRIYFALRIMYVTDEFKII